jgi:aromatic ring-opening dioxygenase catalytic subunit (LigB family)
MPARQPTLFIPHGAGPCFFMDRLGPEGAWDRMAAWLRAVPEMLPERPRALLIVSGHWEEDGPLLTGAASPPLIYDYYGFPPHTYALTYPAPGAPALAARVAALLAGAGFGPQLDPARGFDHGVFIPMKLSFPEADIPIVQVSLLRSRDAAAHLRLGAALQPLRDEGVLIIGSGNTYHNMQVMMRAMRGGAQGAPAGDEFDRWLADAVERPDPAERDLMLARWDMAPGAREANPREEHLIPLHVVAGAAGADRGRRVLRDEVMGAVESAFRFG